MVRGPSRRPRPTGPKALSKEGFRDRDHIAGHDLDLLVQLPGRKLFGVHTKGGNLAPRMLTGTRHSDHDCCDRHLPAAGKRFIGKGTAEASGPVRFPTFFALLRIMKPESVTGTEPTIFDRNARRYAESPVHQSGPSLAVLLRLAEPGPGDVALDVATGTGHTALAVAEHAAEVIGLDVSSKMLAEARRLAAEQGRANVRFVEGSAEALPFPDGQFTLVTSRHAPHHFRSVETFLAEVFRVLKAGGRFVIADQISPAADDQAWIDR